MKSLDAAATALAANQPGAALQHLLDAWRATRSPQLARLVLDVGEQAKGLVHPMASSRRSAPKAWSELEKKRDPATLPWLLDDLESTYRVDLTQEKLERLAEWAPDPRLGAAAMRLLTDGALTERAQRRLGPALLALVRQTGDPQWAGPLRQLAGGADVDPPWPTSLRALAGALAKRRVRAIPSKTLTTLRKLLAHGAARRPGKDALADLFQAVYDAPRDDAPRHVLADALQEQGDPRGTFIALQLARAATGEPPTAAEEKLWARWLTSWSAPLGVNVERWDVESFTRGLAARVTVRPGNRPTRHPAWSTVDTLDAHDDTEALRQLLASAPLRNLRRLDGPLDAVLAALDAEPRALAALEVLSLTDTGATTPAVKALLATSVAAHLAELHLAAPTAVLPALAAASTKHGWRRIVFRDPATGLVCELRSAQRALELRLETMEQITELEATLASFPPGAFLTLRVALPRTAAFRSWAHLEVPERLAALAEAVKGRGATATWCDDRLGQEEPLPSTLSELQRSPLLSEVRRRERARVPPGSRTWFD